MVLIFLLFSPVQRDTNGLSVENNELKLRVQTMEQQVHLQDGEYLTYELIFLVIVFVSNFFHLFTVSMQIKFVNESRNCMYMPSHILDL